MSGLETERAFAGSPVAVEVAVDDPELADRIRTMILQHPDLHLADAGEGATAQVRVTDGSAAGTDVATIVITDRAGVVEALQAGATVVLSLHTDGEDLHAAVRAAAVGLTTLAREFRDLLIDGTEAAGGLERQTEDEAVPIDLTPRERQVLQLMAQGASNKTIARRLEITPHTAKFHVASIIAKLEAAGRTDAVAKAMRLGLVMI